MWQHMEMPGLLVVAVQELVVVHGLGDLRMAIEPRAVTTSLVRMCREPSLHGNEDTEYAISSTSHLSTNPGHPLNKSGIKNSS